MIELLTLCATFAAITSALYMIALDVFRRSRKKIRQDILLVKSTSLSLYQRRQALEEEQRARSVLIEEWRAGRAPQALAVKPTPPVEEVEEEEPSPLLQTVTEYGLQEANLGRHQSQQRQSGARA